LKQLPSRQLEFPSEQASAFKIPHHGSVTAHHADTWTRLGLTLPTAGSDRSPWTYRFIAPSARWRTYNSGKLRHSPITLTAAQRKCVEIAICETCQIRGWSLLAKNARTNHVHSLVAAGITPPDRVLNALKANATRQLRQHGEWLMGSSPWSERGSKRYVWTELGIERAKEYVTSGQDVKIPELDQYRRR